MGYAEVEPCSTKDGLNLNQVRNHCQIRGSSHAPTKLGPRSPSKVKSSNDWLAVTPRTGQACPEASSGLGRNPVAVTSKNTVRHLCLLTKLRAASWARSFLAMNRSFSQPGMRRQLKKTLASAKSHSGLSLMPGRAPSERPPRHRQGR